MSQENPFYASVDAQTIEQPMHEPGDMSGYYRELAHKRESLEQGIPLEARQFLDAASLPWPDGLPIGDYKILNKPLEFRGALDKLSEVMDRANSMTDYRELLALYLETKSMVGRVRLWPEAKRRLQHGLIERSHTTAKDLARGNEKLGKASAAQSTAKRVWRHAYDVGALEAEIARLQNVAVEQNILIDANKYYRWDFDETNVAGIEARHSKILAKAAGLWSQSVVDRYSAFNQELVPSQKRRELDSHLIRKVLPPALEESAIATHSPASAQEVQELIAFSQRVMGCDLSSVEDKPSFANYPLNINTVYLEFMQWIRSHHSLEYVGASLNLDAYNGWPSHCYLVIGDILCRGMAAKDLRAACVKAEGLGTRAGLVMVDAIERILEGDKQSWRDSERRGVDPSVTPVDELIKIQGLNRLPIMQQDGELARVIPPENFEILINMLIRRLVDEAIVPGGRESMSGSQATKSLEQLGAPQALPLLLRHIQKTGYGHTNINVLYAIRSIMDRTDPRILSEGLTGITHNERRILALMDDKDSYFNRFTGEVEQCIKLAEGDFIIAAEGLAGMMADNGFGEDELESFYKSASCFGFADTMTSLRRLSKATGKELRILAEPYFAYCLRTMSPDTEYATIVRTISQVRGEPLAQTFSAADQSLRSKNVTSPIRFAQETLSLCEEIGLDSRDIMESHIDAIAKNLSWFTFGLPEIVSIFATALKESPFQTFQRFRDKMDNGLISLETLAITEKLAQVCSVPQGDIVKPLVPLLVKKVFVFDAQCLNQLDRIAIAADMDFESVALSCGTWFFKPSRNPIMRRLVSPPDGAIERVPLAIARNMQISPELLEVFGSLYASKRLQRGGMERVMILESLGFLNDKGDEGKQILERVLSAVSGSKDDPDRFRKVLHYLQTMDALGEFTLPAVGQTELDAIDAESSDVQKSMSNATDKKERKKFKDRLETLRQKRNNLTGLKGMENTLRDRVVTLMCEKMKLSPEMRSIVERDFDKLSQSGLLQIVPVLVGQYTNMRLIRVTDLLGEATEHIIKDDFLDWKYAPDNLERQLSCYNPGQRAAWVDNSEPVSPPPAKEISSDNRETVWSAMSTVISNALDHYRTQRPETILGPAGSAKLGSELATAELAALSAHGEASHKIAEVRRDAAKNEVVIHTTLLFLANASADVLTDEQSVKQRIQELGQALDALGGLGELGNDARQMIRVLEAEITGGFTVMETDDPIALLNVGVEPVETCQSWRKGSHNDCLMAYVTDANKKILNVVSAEGSVFARSVFTALAERPGLLDNALQDTPLLFLERTYALQLPTAVQRELISLSLRKAVAMGAKLAMSDIPGRNLAMCHELAQNVGYKFSQREVNVVLPPSRNSHVYSDAFGGRLSEFGKPYRNKLFISPSQNLRALARG